MTRLAVACYVLAVLALALSLQAGWAPAVVSVAALASAVALHALERADAKAVAGFADTVSDTRQLADRTAEDVKRLRTEVHATLERLRKPQGF
jgi:hypothetical protein